MTTLTVTSRLYSITIVGEIASAPLFFLEHLKFGHLPLIIKIHLSATVTLKEGNIILQDLPLSLSLSVSIFVLSVSD